MGRLLVMIVWTIGVVTVMTQDLETLHLVGMSDTASIGSKYTLICAWEPSVGQSVTAVKWFSGATFIQFSTTTCAVQIASDDTSGMVITAGYRHQTLTFVNVTWALNGSYWTCENDIGPSSEQRIIVEEPPIVTLRPLSPTTWYGSTFTFICSNDFKPGKWTSRWYIDERLQFSLSENSCSPITKGYNFQCTDYQHIVTITDVTSQADGEMWKCAVAEDVSNTVRLTAYPAPGWPDAVELYTTDTETSITETPTTLICSTRCEDEKYVFHWNISSGNISEIEYNSCESRCTQNITFDVDRTHSYYIVKCTVTNKRTGKDGFAVVKLNTYSKSKQDLETLHLVGMSDAASVGSNYTLICAWEPSDVTVVKWFSSTTFILFNTTTCAVQKSSDDTSGMVITAGYRHQTLTFVNVKWALNGSYWTCENDIGSSSEQRIIVEEPPIVTLRSLSPTTWYGSTFTFFCSNDFEPGKWTSQWYIHEQWQFNLSENNCTPLNQGYNFQCTDYQHIVTITDVTSQDDGEMWTCTAVQDVSNTVRLTAYPAPGWPDAVVLYTTDTETSITETPTTLTCSTRCEDEKYVFHWNISSGNVSEIEYNSCASRCTQNITFDVDRTHSYYIVKCTVTNKRTGKDGFAVVKLNTYSKSKQETMYIYIGLGSAVGAAVVVVACIVVFVYCKRKTSTAESDEVMMDNVLYTSAGTEIPQQEKLVMEDNVLYECGNLESTDARNSPDVEENVLYESSGGTDAFTSAS